MYAPLGSVGIAVGTVSAAVAVVTGSRSAGRLGATEPSARNNARIVPNDEGQPLTPAAVAMDGNTTWLGERALLRGLSHPTQLTASVVGDLHAHAESGDSAPAQPLVRALSVLLRQLAADASTALGVPRAPVAIVVPGENDALRTVFSSAAAAAGITEPLLVDDVVATAVGAGTDPRSGPVLLVDVGGRRTTVALLDAGGPDGVTPVRVAVDSRLGGRDLDELLTAWAIETFALRTGGTSVEGVDRTRLMERVVQAKHQLARSAVVPVYVAAAGQTERLLLDRALLEHFAEPLLTRLEALIDGVLNSPHAGDLDPSSSGIRTRCAEILLVGGSSRLPFIARLVERVTGRVPVESDAPDQVAARGAALVAARRAGRGCDAEPDTLAGRQPVRHVVSADQGSAVSSGSSRDASLGTEGARTAYAGTARPHRRRTRDTVVVAADARSVGSDITHLHRLRPGQRALHVEVVSGDAPDSAPPLLLGKARVALLEGKRPSRHAIEAVRLHLTSDPDGIVALRVNDGASDALLGEFEFDSRAGDERRDSAALWAALAMLKDS